MAYNRTKFGPGKINRALIIQTAFIGDVILTTPLVEVLHASLPGLKLDFLTIPASSQIISNNPHIDEVILFDKKGADKGIAGLWRVASLLKSKRYDLCLVPHRSLRSAILAYATGARQRIGFNRSALKSVFTTVITYQNDKHEIERNLSLLKAIGIESPIQYPRLFSSDEDRKKLKNLLNTINLSPGDRVIAVAPGSVWPTKRWPEAYYASLCKQLESRDFVPVLIGSSEDRNLCDRIAGDAGGTRSIAGLTTLTQSYEFLKLCAGIVTNDSAPLHLGMAARIPVFAIFGPTVTNFGFAPFGENGFVIQQENLRCRPCSIHGGIKCPIKTFACMVELKPEQVLDLVIHRHKKEIKNV